MGNKLKTAVDLLMAEATELQNQGRFDEADTVIAEAENLEDRWDSEQSTTENQRGQK